MLYIYNKVSEFVKYFILQCQANCFHFIIDYQIPFRVSKGISSLKSTANTTHKYKCSIRLNPYGINFL